MDEFLTAKEVAELLKVSEATLARWRGADPIQGPPCLRIEGTVRYPREAMQRWLDERTLGGTLPA